MEATLTEQVPTENLSETVIDIPQRGDFVPCDAKECRQRSYFFYSINNLGSLLSYCYHHGNSYEENLLKVSTLVADYSEDLKENRLQGAP